MNNVLKGGLGLLSYLLFTGGLIGQDHFFLIQKDLQEAHYGEIRSSTLRMEAIKEMTNMTTGNFSSFFSIKTSNDMPSVLGSYIIENNRLVFQPRFLPDPSINYQIEFSFKQLSKLTNKDFGQSVYTTTFQFQNERFKETEIINFYPNEDTLPANILRAYIHFSAPMSFENPYDFISILDFKGDTLKDAFVEIQDGLWNADRTRLTILFHPGRIKRGVGPNVKQGSIFKDRKTYQLAIAKEWLDTNRNMLKSPFNKSFFITPSVRLALHPSDFKVKILREGDRYRVELCSDKILDHALAARMINLRNKDGDIVQDAEITSRTNSILIMSEYLKRGENYILSINPELEDVSGNTFISAFDREKNEQATSAVNTIVIPFKIE